jgi:hypothetical protein
MTTPIVSHYTCLRFVEHNFERTFSERRPIWTLSKKSVYDLILENRDLKIEVFFAED